MSDMLVILLVVSGFLELLVYSFTPLWSRRRMLAVVSVLITSFSTGGLAYLHLTNYGVLIFLMGAYRVLNLLRVVEGRMHAGYLRKATLRTGSILVGLQLGLVAAIELIDIGEKDKALLVIAVLQIIAAVIILSTTIRNLRKTKHIAYNNRYNDKELPTVTVAVPARNETTDLEQCLSSIVANDYPKLEVIVLDDCSQDKTPEIIRGFAQKGVRFISGNEAPKRWLAKNYAYHRLYEESEGGLILFCGVDVRLGPSAIRAMVTELLTRKKSMISILPIRLRADAASAFVQPARYWWELSIPRRIFNRPPVLSTCWIISRTAMKKIGGFKAVQHSIIPERYFARELIKEGGYSFLRSSGDMDIQTVKSVAEQRATTIRTLYPQIRRRPENALLLTLINLGLFVAPFIISGLGFWWELGVVHVLALISSTLLIANHVAIVRVTNPPDVPIAIFNLPIAMLVELTLGYISMFKYEFSLVDWKGRNVCIPVMHVLPSLPKVK